MDISAAPRLQHQSMYRIYNDSGEALCQMENPECPLVVFVLARVNGSGPER